MTTTEPTATEPQQVRGDIVRVRLAASRSPEDLSRALDLIYDRATERARSQLRAEIRREVYAGVCARIGGILARPEGDPRAGLFSLYETLRTELDRHRERNDDDRDQD